MKTIMTVSIKGSRKSLDYILEKLLRNKKVKVVFISWESESMNNVGIGDHVEGDLHE